MQTIGRPEARDRPERRPRLDPRPARGRAGDGPPGTAAQRHPGVHDAGLRDERAHEVERDRARRVGGRVRLACSLVAKPGIVYARMSLRGRPRLSIARATTSRAWVESRPPLRRRSRAWGPVDGLHALHEPRHLDVERLVASCASRAGSSGTNGYRSSVRPQPDIPRWGAPRSGRCGRAADGPAVVVERPLRAMPAGGRVEVDIRHGPARAMPKAMGLGEQDAALVVVVWPSHERSLVDSPWPAAAYAYAARQRRDWDWQRSFRSSARAMAIGAAAQIEQHRGTGRAACDDGGPRPERPRRPRRRFVRPGTSSASKEEVRIPNGELQVADADVLARLVVASARTSFR